jgi:hypothetical protein
MSQIPNEMRFLGVNSSLIDLVEKKDYINNEKTEYYSLDDIRGYKVYTALLSQSGTDAPTATVLENTIGNIVWSRVGEGLYRATLTGAFIEDKTTMSIGITSIGYSDMGQPFLVNGEDFQPNFLVISTQNTIASLLADGFLGKTPIEIRVYN